MGRHWPLLVALVCGCGSGEGPASGASDAGMDGPPAVPVLVRAGGTANCLVMSDGSLWCWGYNTDGKFANGTTITPKKPILIDEVDDVVDVGVGAYHICVLHADRTVSCWGDNTYGTLGDGTYAPSSEPVRVLGIDDVAELSVGARNIIRRNDGQLFAWGDGVCGSFANGTISSASAPVAVGVSPASDIGAWSHTCAVNMDGIVTCWGCNDDMQLGSGAPGPYPEGSPPLQVPGLSNIVDVEAGGATCGRAEDNRVWCWGVNEHGQVGNGTTGDPTGPVDVPALTGVRQFALAGRHSCAIFEDRRLACWGYNGCGQLGDGTETDRSTPTFVEGFEDVISLDVGWCHTCAIKGDGSVWCWGLNNDAELGIGVQFGVYPTPQRVLFD